LILYVYLKYYRTFLIILKKNKMKNILYLVFLSFIMVSCTDDDDSNQVNANTAPVATVGMNYALSNQSFEETYTTLRTSLENNPNISIIAEVDHSQNASSVNLNLNPTRVIFFGNPALGTPLMNVNQQAGLDLPQRMLVYQNSNRQVYIGYNSTAFLQSRHSLNSEAMTLNTISEALSMLAAGASQSTVESSSINEVAANEGLIVNQSNQSFNDTYNDLRNAISSNPNLMIVAELDHQANAQSVNMTLPPTKVLIFGNPNLGTPLMINAQTTALDLPQKMLVYENTAGEVMVAYNNPNFLASRHGITNNEDVLMTISNALQMLSNAARDN